MKKTTCKQLKGACDEIITGETAEEMARNSREHAMKKHEQGDKDHMQAMQAMKDMSKEDQQEWYRGFVASFDTLEDA